MIRLHGRPRNSAPGPGSDMRVFEGGNAMNEVDPAPAATKRRITLWPSIVMLVFFSGLWVLQYSDVIGVLFALVINFFSVICIIGFLCLIFLRRPKKSVFYLIPVLVAATTGWLIIPRVAVIRPVQRSFFDSRDYVEFLMYDAKYHVREDARRNGYKYKEWTLPKNSGTSYQIIYDAKGRIAWKDETEGGGCYETVLNLGDHFYFDRGECPGVF